MSQSPLKPFARTLQLLFPFRSKRRLVVDRQLGSPVHHLSHPGLLVERLRPWPIVCLNVRRRHASRSAGVKKTAAHGCEAQNELEFAWLSGWTSFLWSSDFWAQAAKAHVAAKRPILLAMDTLNHGIIVWQDESLANRRLCCNFRFKLKRTLRLIRGSIKEMRPTFSRPGVGLGTRCTTCFMPCCQFGQCPLEAEL